jgi:CRP-like cAMP-binding protein
MSAAVLDGCGGLPLRVFAAGDTVLAEGTRSGKLYVLVSGSVETVKGDVQINTSAEPGAFFGEIAALLDAPHSATVRTLAPSTFRVADDPLAFMRSSPEVALALARLLARRLHSLTSYLVDLKHQFQDHESHLGMVDDVLESLLHHHDDESSPGSDRCPDPDPTTE